MSHWQEPGAGSWETLSQVRPEGGNQVIRSTAPERMFTSQLLLFCFFGFWLLWCEQFSTMYSCHDALCYHKPKLRSQLFKLQAKANPFSLRFDCLRQRVQVVERYMISSESVNFKCQQKEHTVGPSVWWLYFLSLFLDKHKVLNTKHLCLCWE